VVDRPRERPTRDIQNRDLASEAARHDPGINNVSVGGPDPQLTLSHSVVAANRLHGSPAIALQGGGIFTAFPVTLTRALVAGNEPDQCFGC
jgi:hypothetical protein